MIAKLKGIADFLGDDYLIIDVGGVGYKVSASARTLAKISQGQKVSMLIETVVREDAFLLYGFYEPEEQQWFNILTSVQGVGAKVGMNILSALSPSELSMAIASGDKASLGRANGVGPKLALRLATELKDKVKTVAPNLKMPAHAGASSGSVMEEAISALENLGYVRFSIMETVASHLSGDAELSVEQLIKKSLKDLAVK